MTGSFFCILNVLIVDILRKRQASAFRKVHSDVDLYHISQDIGHIDRYFRYSGFRPFSS